VPCRLIAEDCEYLRQVVVYQCSDTEAVGHDADYCHRTRLALAMLARRSVTDRREWSPFGRARSLDW
jgi:alpha-D-ribose 1-methylphosphonate 5-phosphate C-P lyase